MLRRFSLLCVALLFSGCTSAAVKDATQTYPTEEECTEATASKCDFLMCDYVPAAKTYEEVCGRGFKEGWAPMGGQE